MSCRPPLPHRDSIAPACCALPGRIADESLLPPSFLCPPSLLPRSPSFRLFSLPRPLLAMAAIFRRQLSSTARAMSVSCSATPTSGRPQRQEADSRARPRFQNVYFDLEKNGEPLGRVVFKLVRPTRLDLCLGQIYLFLGADVPPPRQYDDVVPKTAVSLASVSLPGIRLL